MKNTKKILKLKIETRMILKERMLENTSENQIVDKIKYVRTCNMKLGITVCAVLVFLSNVLLLAPL